MPESALPHASKQPHGAEGVPSRARLPEWATPELLAVSFRTAWPDRTSRSLLSLARRWMLRFALIQRDHQLLHRGARCGRVRGGEAIARLAAAGQGCLVLSFHFGPFHYLPIELARLGYDVDVIMSGRFLRGADRGWAAAVRRAGGTLRCLDAEQPNTLLAAARAMAAGRAVVVLVDAELGVARTARHERLLELDFLDIPMGFRLAPLLLAARTGTPIAFARTNHPLRTGREITFTEPTSVADEGEARAVLERVVRWFETEVARTPEEWLGWATPTFCWTSVGDAPRVTKKDLGERTTQLRELLERESPPRGARWSLYSDPTEVAVIEFADAPALLHGRARRFIKADALTVALVKAAHDRLRLDAGTAARFDVSAERLAEMIARLTLSDLAQLRRG